MKITREWEGEQQGMYRIEYGDERDTTWSKGLPKDWTARISRPYAPETLHSADVIMSRLKKVYGFDWANLDHLLAAFETPEYLNLSMSRFMWDHFIASMTKKVYDVITRRGFLQGFSSRGDVEIIHQPYCVNIRGDICGLNTVKRLVERLGEAIRFVREGSSEESYRLDFEGVKEYLQTLDTLEAQIDFLLNVENKANSPYTLRLSKRTDAIAGKDDLQKSWKLVYESRHCLSSTEIGRIQELRASLESTYFQNIHREFNIGASVIQAEEAEVAEVKHSGDPIDDRRILVKTSLSDIKRVFTCLDGAGIISMKNGAIELLTSRLFVERSVAKDIRGNWDSTKIDGKAKGNALVEFTVAIANHLPEAKLDDVIYRLDKLRKKH